MKREFQVRFCERLLDLRQFFLSAGKRPTRQAPKIYFSRMLLLVLRSCFAKSCVFFRYFHLYVYG